ncbi:hypothetical protein PVAG01_06668 [Phlyctema vagabunda]|uniref:Uncharacterized protein n=1 Tax=Phlyctema vagabunda TaxID=108571 RepID=A0ABR4PHD9_9HELO
MDMDWSLPFCLACDRQTDGEVYCSESCRLAEYEKACSSSGSTPSSPQFARASTSWPTTKPSHHGFYLAPAYNFSTQQPHRTTPATQSPTLSYSRPQSSPTQSSRPVLTPSSSQSSLFSMRSNTSLVSQEGSNVSDDDRKALRDYERSFDQSRYARRQSTN